MTTLDESTTVTQSTLEPSENDTVRPGAQAWQLGILTDRAGHVHLGAVVGVPVVMAAKTTDMAWDA